MNDLLAARTQMAISLGFLPLGLSRCSNLDQH
jgi:hypothetical protein